MFPISKRVMVAVPAIALILATAACSSGGKAPETNSTGAAGQQADTPKLTVALISHAPAGDAFFDTIIKGAKDAGAKDNIDVQYSGDGDVTKQAALIQVAIDSKVDGIAVSMPNPDALIPTIKKAVDAGIPVTIYNAGDRDWQKTGALSFFGEPEVLAGEFAGEALNTKGYKNALCVVQAQGQVQLEDRCQGMKSKFTGTTENLFADGTDTSGYVSTVKAKLSSDPTIDAVVTLGPALGVAVANELKTSNPDVGVATYAMNTDVYPLIQSGDIDFTIDQQPYLQGYMAIDAIWFYKKNGNVLGANQSIATGPLVINKDNVDAVKTFAEAGGR
ncbi:MAG TPA: substrate-binding domain-containing protein [Propionibacteriaceae bacterium]